MITLELLIKLQQLALQKRKMLKRIYIPLHFQARKMCVTVAPDEKPEKPNRPKVILDEKIKNLILEDKLKPRKHFGVNYKTTIHLPIWFCQAAKQAVKEHRIADFREEVKTLTNYLMNRHPPAEHGIIEIKYTAIRNAMEERRKKIAETASPEMLNKLDEKIKRASMIKLHQHVYAWKPIEYNYSKGIIYLVSRGAHEYSVLYTIFSEITKRDPKFKPKNIFDFGSGVGTVAWAASQFWSKSIIEYLGVEPSQKMIHLAEWLSKKADPPIKNMFFKEHFPIVTPPYDIVVSAYSLMELPNRKSRIEAVLNLWKKTNKYLILVEQGSNAGFKIINEARYFLTLLLRRHQKKNFYKGYIFAPCPHELPCPRYTTDDTPCNFEVSFFPLPFWSKGRPITDRYSYVVIKKGDERQEIDNWPRIVRSVKSRSKLAMCRMCTKDGNLQEIIFTKSKHEMPLYRCARKSDWGDRLPVEIINNSNEIITGQSELNDSIELEDLGMEAEDALDIKNKELKDDQ